MFLLQNSFLIQYKSDHSVLYTVVKKNFLNKIVACVIFFLPFSGNAFGVLTHEAIIDGLWEKSIVPILKAKYPSSTAEELKEAHAYAYGGAVAPDMGFYPFGSALFTNLVHYVRSGDMVTALLKNANTINQYAFAIGLCRIIMQIIMDTQ